MDYGKLSLYFPLFSWWSSSRTQNFNNKIIFASFSTKVGKCSKLIQLSFHDAEFYFKYHCGLNISCNFAFVNKMKNSSNLYLNSAVIIFCIWTCSWIHVHFNYKFNFIYFHKNYLVKLSSGIFIIVVHNLWLLYYFPSKILLKSVSNDCSQNCNLLIWIHSAL